MTRELMIAASLLVLGGCAGVEDRPLIVECGQSVDNGRPGMALVGQQYGPQMTPMPLDSIQFTDTESLEKVAVQHLSATRTPTQVTRVTARFVSCVDEPVAIRVRTSFLDGVQRPAEPSSAWRTVHLQPRLTAAYSELSTSVEVANYLLEVRSVR
mgnify:CR=1 FL=1